MHSLIQKFLLAKSPLCIFGMSLAFGSHCSDLPAAAVGQLQVALTSGVGDSLYILKNARFEVSGDEAVTLETGNDLEPAVLERALPVGQYQLRLLDGWQLQRGSPDQETPISATLLSDNPQPFAIETGNITGVVFRFQTQSQVIETSTPGRLNVGIEVDGVPAARIVISELLSNPSQLPDSQGEWFELFNAGEQAVDLSGCRIRRDSQEIVLPGGVAMDPGQFLTFANSPEPGFSPNLIYSSLSLPNSGSHQLSLQCQDHILDVLDFDSALIASSAGHSISLSEATLATGNNDNPSDWCQATISYNGDFGTPGAANPSCPHVD